MDGVDVGATQCVHGLKKTSTSTRGRMGVHGGLAGICFGHCFTQFSQWCVEHLHGVSTHSHGVSTHSHGVSTHSHGVSIHSHGPHGIWMATDEWHGAGSLMYTVSGSCKATIV
eukprot:TRINITY_DN1727_c1_g1_i1.p3 TRINITY_DN1727_c1_g1~~TRINITY_DN1727_c1_g1_i1.p3  ORF type:complete len:113 (+),score=5.31 TRINITY_DN1727_c1_g1_i1:168-506(+)